MSDKEIFKLAEKYGDWDDFGRWMFKNDDQLLKFVEAIAEAEQPDLARVGEVGIWGEWVGLTDQEYTTIFRASENLLDFCHAIEARLKEKNAQAV